MLITVIGSGSWGTAVAGLVAKSGAEVVMWARKEEVANSITKNHVNPRYLDGYILPDNVRATSDLSESIKETDAIILVAPSVAIREISNNLSKVLADDVPVIVLTKGIEFETGALMAEVVHDELKGNNLIAALSGPNHAEEVCRDLPAAAVVACDDPEITKFFQDIFNQGNFRVYASSDVIGVEVCSAAKNVMALACGMAAGFGYGDNTQALIMSRGLAEMTRIVYAKDGEPMTCMGLAGVGDLIATCTSQHSRNRTFGYEFAKGETLDQYYERTHMVVEGALACKSLHHLAQEKNIRVPIIDAVYQLLYEGATFDEISTDLYARDADEEFYGISSVAGE